MPAWSGIEGEVGNSTNLKKKKSKFLRSTISMAVVVISASLRTLSHYNRSLKILLAEKGINDN